MFLLGIVLNTSLVVSNYLVFQALRRGRLGYLLYCLAPATVAVAASVGLAIYAYRGISSDDFLEFAATLPMLVLALPLSYLWFKEKRGPDES